MDFFTDGSNRNGKVDAVVYYNQPEIKRIFRSFIPNSCGIFQAEILAITMAKELIWRTGLAQNRIYN